MKEIDLSLLEELTRRKDEEQAKGRRMTRGGEPPNGDGLEPRVRALEVSVASIDKTLAVMSEQLKHLASKDDVRAVQIELATRCGKLDADVAALGAKLDAEADATDLAELKGRVARIPTVPVLTSILIFVLFPFAAVTWVLRHLPPAWSSALQ